MIRVVVVDDEPIARRTLSDLLAAESDLHVVGTFASAEEALPHLATDSVDVLFLDIEMPGLAGIDLVDALPDDVQPLVVFVTAHSDHAVRAFELSALDYVLKPFDDERLSRAVARARRRLSERRVGDVREDLRNLTEQLGRQRRSLAIRSVRGVDFVAVDDLVWVEAEDSYVRLHTRDGRFHLMRTTMTRLEVELDARDFVRVHRSAIVRLDQVRHMESLDHGDARIVLHDGTKVRVSRTRGARVRAALGLDRIAGPPPADDP